MSRSSDPRHRRQWNDGHVHHCMHERPTVAAGGGRAHGVGMPPVTPMRSPVM